MWEEMDVNDHLEPDEWLLTPERDEISLYIRQHLKTFIGPIQQYTRENVGSVLEEYEKWWASELVIAHEAIY